MQFYMIFIVINQYFSNLITNLTTPNVGNLATLTPSPFSVTQTASISACARRETCGCVITARKKDCIAEVVVSAPPVYRLLALHLISCSCSGVSEPLALTEIYFETRSDTYDGSALPMACQNYIKISV